VDINQAGAFPLVFGATPSGTGCLHLGLHLGDMPCVDGLAIAVRSRPPGIALPRPSL
jgi:hypothetical protein